MPEFVPRFRFLLILPLTLMASLALAGGHQGGSGPMGGGSMGGPGAGPQGEMRHMTKMADKLALSEAQKNDFLALMDLYRPRFEALAKRGKEDRQALLEMAPDADGYGELTTKVSEEAGRSAAEMVTLMSELQGLVYALLTKEQQEQFMTMRAEQRAKMQEYREKCEQDGDCKRGMHGKKGHGKHHKKHHGGKHGEHGSCPHHGKDGEYCPHHDKESAKESANEGTPAE